MEWPYYEQQEKTFLEKNIDEKCDLKYDFKFLSYMGIEFVIRKCN